MRKFLILILISTILLSGCSPLFNLNGWVIPDDLEFLEVVESLDTPEKICAYMKENFTSKDNSIYAPDPYTFWKLKEGDCNDFSCFAVFCANYNGYEVYQIKILYDKYVYGKYLYHMIGVFKENDHYTFSELHIYYDLGCNSFEDIMKTFIGWISYKVYDYEMNLIEEGGD